MSKQRKLTQAYDSVSKNIQNQIANAQKQLQELFANKDMSIEEKMKKRQEIQQQINELNQQLRQHQMEQRKEKQKTKVSSMEDMLGRSKKSVSKAGKQSTGFSQASMQAIISADSAMKQAKVQGSVVTRMEGRAGVLETEIKLDMARGEDVTKKKEELAEVEQKAITAQTAQLNTLAEANKELEAAAKADEQAETAEDKEKTTDKMNSVSKEKDEKKIAGTEGNGARVFDTKTKSDDVSVPETWHAPNTTNTVKTMKTTGVSVPETITYTYVDVRL